MGLCFEGSLSRAFDLGEQVRYAAIEVGLIGVAHRVPVAERNLGQLALPDCS